jgi:UDP-galactopyranose mutase
MTEDILCFSHLRWNFVYQRPQHLLSRFANHSRVFFIEEPLIGEGEPRFEVNRVENVSVWVVTPKLPAEFPEKEKRSWLMQQLDGLISDYGIGQYHCWYYSPLAFSFSNHLEPILRIYDCMDELSAFKFAPPELTLAEAELFGKVDIVFTGGHHLYEAKKQRHQNIHPFPSSIDKHHFRKARYETAEPADQLRISHPRLGFYGVVDERFDIDLLREVAALRPEWQFVIIGPVVKIDPATLPRALNIHYLGGKSYNELPTYLAGWDIAIMPFALNDATKYISPTKTPEYLAGGKPVISTSIRDVVRPYGENGLVRIADTPDAFVKAAEDLLDKSGYEEWLYQVDEFLADNSWDNTWSRMNDLIKETATRKRESVAA